MNNYNVSDTSNRQMEDPDQKSLETRRTVGTVSVSEETANVIKVLVQRELSAHFNFNLPWTFSNQETILDKMENTSLNTAKQQRGLYSNLQHLAELESLEGRPGAQKILKRRQELPIYATIDKILDTIKNNQVTVVYSEAGCGKTTQIPQYILDNAIKSRVGSMCRIICALPRRTNAIRAAKHVAEDRGVAIGHDSPVGYHIGNDNASARSNASITYYTSGVLLRLMLSDPFLTEASHLILDEVQERDMITDFLLRLIKNLITKRPSLKVLILCSTIYHSEFVNYFNGCANINVPGFVYPVEEFYLEEVLLQTGFSFAPGKPEETLTRTCLTPKSEPYPKHIQQTLDDPNADKLNYDLIIALITEINYYDRDGAILVFLPGVGDITILERMLDQIFTDVIIPIHGAIINDFQTVETYKNKIYLATNVAESVLNLNDVAYVIDTGRVKTRLYDDGYTDALKFHWVSLKNIEQRRRKAGRSRPGKCYHLFKKSIIARMDPEPAPEIIRKNLDEVILRMKVNGLGNAKEFLTKCITPIPEEDIQQSVARLQAINILDNNENLTVMGHTLVNLSVDPAKGKMIYLGAIFSCLEPVLTIAAHLIKNPILLESPIRAERCTSDHIALYQIIQQYEETEDRRKSEYCKTYHVNKYQIAKIISTKLELANKLRIIHPNMDYKSHQFNVNSNNMNLVRAIVSSGLYPSVAIIRNHDSCCLRDITVTTLEGRLRQFHINSVNARQTNFPAPLLVYNGIFNRNNMRYLCENTIVSPLSLIMFSGKLSMSCDNSGNFLNLSENLRFRCDKQQTAKVLLELREKVEFIIENEIYNLFDFDWARNTQTIRILQMVIDLIECENPGDRFPYVFKT